MLSEADKKIWILSHYTQFSLAKKIESKTDKVIFKDIIKWGKFENNYPNLFINNIRELIGKDVIFIASLHKPAIMFEQLSVINVLPRHLINSLTLLLPFFPCGTMEKIEKEGQIATAKTVANLLTNIPITRTGPAQIIIYDIHSLQQQFYFGDTVIPRLESCIPLLHEQINLLKANNEKIAIVFPDDGASKRFHRFFYTSYRQLANCADNAQEVDDIIFCAKIRYEGRLMNSISQEIFPEYHYILVDDVVNTGNTILESARICCEKGALNISMFSIHAVFPQDSWKKFLNPLSTNSAIKLKNFWITDSIPHANDICQQAGEIFKLISISSIFSTLF